MKTYTAEEILKMINDVMNRENFGELSTAQVMGGVLGELNLNTPRKDAVPQFSNGDNTRRQSKDEVIGELRDPKEPTFFGDHKARAKEFADLKIQSPTFPKVFGYYELRKNRTGIFLFDTVYQKYIGDYTDLPALEKAIAYWKESKT